MPCGLNGAVCSRTIMPERKSAPVSLAGLPWESIRFRCVNPLFTCFFEKGYKRTTSVVEPFEVRLMRPFGGSADILPHPDWYPTTDIWGSTEQKSNMGFQDAGVVFLTKTSIFILPIFPSLKR